MTKASIQIVLCSGILMLFYFKLHENFGNLAKFIYQSV